MSARTDAHRLRELAPPHRYAVLLCFLRDTYVESVDQAVEMYGKIITQTFRRARNELDERIVARRRLTHEVLEDLERLLEVVLEHWNDALRLTASIKTVSVKPSAMLRKLGAYRQQNRLYLALGLGTAPTRSSGESTQTVAV